MATGNLCPELAKRQNGIITAENANSLVLNNYQRTSGTKVKVTCYWEDVYEVVGNAELTCTNGKWVPDPPECLRKDRTSQTDNNSTTTDLTPSDDSKDYTTILILVSVACGVLLLILIAAIIYRCCCMSRERKGKADDTESLFSSQTSTKQQKRAQQNGTHNPIWGSHYHDHRHLQKSPPGTLWSVPPSQRKTDLLQYHLHKKSEYSPSIPGFTQARGSLAQSTVPGTGPVSIQATWRGFSTTREWTYISVDQLLRDMEQSRMTNPNHSWMDFASLSSRPPKSQRL